MVTRPVRRTSRSVLDGRSLGRCLWETCFRHPPESTGPNLVHQRKHPKRAAQRDSSTSHGPRTKGKNQRSSSTRQLDQSWPQHSRGKPKEQLNETALPVLVPTQCGKTKRAAQRDSSTSLGPNTKGEQPKSSSNRTNWACNRTATARNIRCIIEATTTIGPGRRNEQIAENGPCHDGLIHPLIRSQVREAWARWVGRDLEIRASPSL